MFTFARGYKVKVACLQDISSPGIVKDTETKIVNPEIIRRAAALQMTIEGYKYRIGVPLKGHKIGTTTPEELDFLIESANTRILDILESTWKTETGKSTGELTGWAYGGEVMDVLRKYVNSQLAILDPAKA